MSRRSQVAVGLFALTMICFGQVCFCGFIDLDDPDYVSHNIYVTGGLTAANVEWALTESPWACGYWVPLTWMSLQLDASIYGASSAWGFHLTNLLLHGCCAVAFFLVLERMTGALWLSAVAAGIWALHPLRVESVAWVTERKDVLAGLFMLLTIGAYVWYVEVPTIGRFALVFLACVAGMLSKPTLVTLPFVLWLLDYWPLSRLRFGQAPLPQYSFAFPVSRRRILLEKIPLLIAALSCTYQTYYYSDALGAVVQELTLSQCLGVAASGVLSYLEKTLWPVDLAVFYPFAFPSAYRVVMSGIVVAAITLGLLALGRRQPALIVGWLWFLGTLVPNSGIVQAGGQAYADRFTYVPHFGLAIAAVWGIGDLVCRLPRPALIGPVLAGGLLAILGSLTWMQVRHWQDNETLFTHALSAGADSCPAHFALGLHYLREGDLDNADLHSAQATALIPQHRGAQWLYGEVLLARGFPKKAYFELARNGGMGSWNPIKCYLIGAALAELGRWKSARKYMQESVAYWDDYPGHDPRWALGYDTFAGTHRRHACSHRLLGEIELREGNAEKARQHFSAAVDIMPDLAESHHWLGVAYVRLGRWDEAERSLRKAVELDPTDAVSRGYLAYVHDRQANTALAAQEYADLLTRFPEWPKATSAAAMKRITRSRFLDSAMARELAQQVCQATDFKEAEWLDTLAAVEAADGNFVKAAEIARKALVLQPLAQEIQTKLRRYESRQALPVELDP